MSKPVRCRRCGTLFIPEHPLLRLGPWRYCPRCRGPLPPTRERGSWTGHSGIVIESPPDKLSHEPLPLAVPQPRLSIPHGAVLGHLTGSGGLRLDPAITTFVVYLDTDRVTVACPACGTQRDFRGSSISGPGHR